MISNILVLIILIGLSSCLTKNFNQGIANQIFEQNELYLVLVVASTDGNILIEFEQYCIQKQNCIVLKSSNDQYQHITSFIGYEGNDYFLIIDAQQHLKYILPINQSIDTNALEEFQAQFQAGILEPYFASQDPDQLDHDQRCLKLVGKNYQDFLVEDEPVKIVYLYTTSQFCQICSDLLKDFRSIAEQYFERKVIRFGYIDVLKNDHRFIKDEIIPYFLIYINQNFDDPYGVGADEFNEFEGYVKQLVKDIKENRNIQGQTYEEM